MRYHRNPFLREFLIPSGRENHKSELYRSPNTESLKSVANFTLVISSPFDSNHSTFKITPKVSPSVSLRQQPRSLESSKSATKCIEYHNIVNHQEGPIAAFPGTDIPLPTSGVAESSCLVGHLVVGGRTSSTEIFPHVVALGKQTEDHNFIFQCGGSLISPKWILTAAHCTHGPGGVTIARLGIDRLSDNSTGSSISIKRTIRHPSYSPPAMYGDIALLELEESVNFTNRIQPACLHQQYHHGPPSAWVCGWGATEYGEEKSDTLQEAFLDVVDNIACAIKHNSSTIAVPDGVVPSMICAGSPRDNWRKDTCYGDSGGPLQIHHPTHPCLYEIIGVTSFGTGCAFADSPGVYTRVSHYLDWIENIVWPESS
ncbi:serine protease 33-like [Venturia canescens]|uniref:serine protease 33-like n=1 Tax=Venturia canescens TaxID=32260 RepID=UPI001C9CABDE|nr:serine protease 33-like [Venturia canescens]